MFPPLVASLPGRDGSAFPSKFDPGIESAYADRVSARYLTLSIIFSRMSTPAPRSRAAISSSVKREISNSTLIILSACSNEIFRTPYTSWTRSSADIARSPGGTRYRKATSIIVMSNLFELGKHFHHDHELWKKHNLVKTAQLSGSSEIEISFCFPLWLSSSAVYGLKKLESGIQSLLWSVFPTPNRIGERYCQW
jgi:hypothetical protein